MDFDDREFVQWCEENNGEIERSSGRDEEGNMTHTINCRFRADKYKSHSVWLNAKEIRGTRHHSLHGSPPPQGVREVDIERLREIENGVSSPAEYQMTRNTISYPE